MNSPTSHLPAIPGCVPTASLRRPLACWFALALAFAGGVHAQLTNKQLDAFMREHPLPAALPADGVHGTQATTNENAETRAAIQNGSASLDDQLTGIGFGAGLAVLYVNGSRPVESVSIDENNTVHFVTKSKMRAGAIFEMHWLFDELPFSQPADSEKLAPRQQTLVESVWGLHVANASAPQANVVRRHVSWGPVFTAEVGDNVIRSVGLGAMIAFQHYKVNTAGDVTPHGRAFNLGLVVFAEPNVKRVQGSFTDGQVVPAGTTIDLQEEHRFGYGLVFSTRF